MNAIPTIDEIRDVVFSMNSDSAAGPDGFSALFFQHYWSVVKNDVHNVVVEFFYGVPMPRSFTSTTIVLIPKVENPGEWSEYRPISLCNVTNKIVSKLVNMRLAKFLPKIVSPNQSGFVKGRSIYDNIVMAMEMVHDLNWRHKLYNVILKLDMSKAYDRLDWNFLRAILSQFGFNEGVVQLISNCFSNCWFSILINGKLEGFFKSSRGLRQGEALSPALFIIAAEFLSRSLNRLFLEKNAMYFQTKGRVKLTHLSYADDIIIFTSFDTSGLDNILKFLDDYESILGQRINKDKSSIILPKLCPAAIQRDLICRTGFNIAELPINYLGAPLFVGNKRAVLYEGLLEKILQPPKSTVHVFEQLLARFFWGSYNSRRRKHWVSWSKICRPKEEGGLGIRRLEDVIKAFSFKLWWRLRQQNSLWANMMEQKYYRGFFPGHTQIKAHDSSVWKRLCNIRQEAQKKIYWVLGQGSCSFWHDHWCRDQPLANLVAGNKPHRVMHNLWLDGNCDISLLSTIVPHHLISSITSVLINSDKDVLIWKDSSSGLFSISSIWNRVRSVSPRSLIFNQIWNPMLTPTISVFLWRLLLGKIPLDSSLQKLGISLASKCQCCRNVETVENLFTIGMQSSKEPLKNSTNMYAELYAIWRGLELVAERNLQPIWIETDYMPCYRIIQNAAPPCGPWDRLDGTPELNPDLFDPQFSF
ncbi:uncharacterized protein LOC127254464 [Andrographis paniculata]|uniref:uncharacterized protein LOC127254464 n=1 Tax=Andrographis paniculata TaxID=175694 RepID=UPI0021E6E547|nr:uncharacterized protein LOC127254464 [Andrographis paniculata]